MRGKETGKRGRGGQKEVKGGRGRKGG